MKKILMLSLILCFLTSCKIDNKPKIVHRNNGQVIIQPKKDSTIIELADLPIQIDSTNYLIHPIGNFNIEGRGGKILYKSSGYGQDFSVSNSGGDRIQGNFTNLKFQHFNSDELISITDDFIKIKSATFLRSIFNTIKKQYLVYEVTDKDSNQDGELDYNDITAFYLSKIDGSGFIKISKENRELINWEVLKFVNRLYFKSVEDINKDGTFDKSDKFHYKYIDFNTDETKVIEYQPI